MIKSKISKNYFQAIATMIGSTIGAGIFTLPYVAQKSGIIVFLSYVVFLGSIQFYINMLYAEIILSTKKKHRVSGYIEKYYNKKFKNISIIIVLLSKNLTLLAYLIIGGIFLNQIFEPFFGGSNLIYSFIFLIIGALLTFNGFKFVSKTELTISIFMLISIVLIAIKSAGHSSVENFQLVNFKYIFLPYGPVCFAIIGASSIPIVCKLLAHKKENIKNAIFWGNIIPIIITIIFTISIVGITGNQTTKDALVGLDNVLGNGAVKFILIFGILSILTSFIINIQALKETYWWDLKINKKIAWILSIVIPYIFLILGLNDATKVIGLTGAIAGGLIGVLYILLALKVKKNPEQDSIIKNKLTKKIAIIISSVYFLGLIYEIWTIFL